MLGEICAEIKNYFVLNGDIHTGDWEISNGQISPSLNFPTEYIRIVGSRLNDGVYKVSELATTLKDETFHGGIWIMSVPADFLALASEIAEWQKVNGGVGSSNMSPFTSESFGGYSYSKASGGSIENGGASVPTWQSQYANRLKIYRKVRAV